MLGGLRHGCALASAADDVRREIEIGCPGGAAERNVSPQGACLWQPLPFFMWATTRLPAARCPTTSRTSTIQVGLADCGPAFLNYGLPGTVGALLTEFAAETIIMRMAAQAGIRQVLPEEVDSGHLIRHIGRAAGAP